MEMQNNYDSGNIFLTDYKYGYQCYFQCVRYVCIMYPLGCCYTHILIIHVSYMLLHHPSDQSFFAHHFSQPNIATANMLCRMWRCNRFLFYHYHMEGRENT